MTVAEQRPVEVGEWVKSEGDLKNAWIIKSGLKEGDQVVIEGTARIFYPGMPIQPVPAKEQQSPSEIEVGNNIEIDNKVKKSSSISDDIKSEIENEIKNKSKSSTNSVEK